jgi:hypothetical protein
LGCLRYELGEYARARKHWQRALTVFTDLGVPEADEVQALLDKSTDDGANRSFG